MKVVNFRWPLRMGLTLGAGFGRLEVAFSGTGWMPDNLFLNYHLLGIQYRNQWQMVPGWTTDYFPYTARLNSPSSDSLFVWILPEATWNAAQIPESRAIQRYSDLYMLKILIDLEVHWLHLANWHLVITAIFVGFPNFIGKSTSWD